MKQKHYPIGLSRCKKASAYMWLGAGFMLSLTSEFVCAVCMCFLLLLLKRGAAGSVIALLLIVFRTTVINPVIAASTPNLSILKWVLIFTFSANIVVFEKVPIRSDNAKLKEIGFLLIACVLYIMLVAFINSSYPVVSIFKSISFSFVFFAVMKGVAVTHNEYDWLEFLFRFFLLVFLLSLFTIPIMALRVSNGRAFQGITLQPNTFSIYGAAFVSILLNRTFKRLALKYILLVLVLFMIYISESRTGMIATLAIVTIQIFKIIKKKPENSAFLIAVSVIFALTVAIGLSGLVMNFFDSLYAFVFKGNVNSLLFSRQIQVDIFMHKFSAHPILGTGFMVPYNSGTRTFSFTFDLFVESGNILLAVLGDTGIFGLFLFMFLYSYIYVTGNKNLSSLFWLPFVVSMGEMVFFSTNSMGLLLYIFFGIYTFADLTNISPNYSLSIESPEMITHGLKINL